MKHWYTRRLEHIHTLYEPWSVEDDFRRVEAWLALGVDDACSYPRSGLSGLGTGDVLLIGTDGIWETQNASSEKFGKERVGTIARSHHRLSAEGILQAVLNTLAEFRGKAQQEDDITLIVIKATGTGQR